MSHSWLKTKCHNLSDSPNHGAVDWEKIGNKKRKENATICPILFIMGRLTGKRLATKKRKEKKECFLEI
jgi:hypothetical protein